MFDRSSQLNLLLDLESRQDDLMLRLDELDCRVKKTLAECQILRSEETSLLPPAPPPSNLELRDIR
jgi:hypothetical protein